MEEAVKTYDFSAGELRALVGEGVLPPEAVVGGRLDDDFRFTVESFRKARERGSDALRYFPDWELLDGRIVSAPQHGMAFNYAACELGPAFEKAYGEAGRVWSGASLPLVCDPWNALTPALTVLPADGGLLSPASTALLGLVIARPGSGTLVDRLAAGGLPTCWVLDVHGTLTCLETPTPAGYLRSTSIDPRSALRPPGAAGDVVVAAMFLPGVRARVEAGEPTAPPVEREPGEAAVLVERDPVAGRTTHRLVWVPADTPHGLIESDPTAP